MSNTYQTGNATKRNILEQSFQLFFQKGYESTTYSDISTAAGVNRALIPYHFNNKAVLGTSVYQEIVHQTLSILDELLDIRQFSADFAGMLHLMAFYRLLAVPAFSRFCVQVLADAGNRLFIPEEEKEELCQLSKKVASLSGEELDLLTHMNIGIKQQMIQYLYEHPDTSTSSIAGMHTSLVLSYTGQSRKKSDELIQAACEVLDLLSFEIDSSFHVSISYR